MKIVCGIRIGNMEPISAFLLALVCVGLGSAPMMDTGPCDWTFWTVATVVLGVGFAVLL